MEQFLNSRGFERVSLDLNPAAEPVIYPDADPNATTDTAAHITSARDLHQHALTAMATVRRYDHLHTYDYRVQAIRDKAFDDLAASLDTLIAAVETMQEQGR